MGATIESLSHSVAGMGSICLRLHGDEAIFSELSYRYPLKLLSPRVIQPGVAIAYVVTYGGGLVGGDHIHLKVDVGSGTALLLLTQGSTKVFKTRPGGRLSSGLRIKDGGSTVQNLDATICGKGLLLLLPDPVTCFSNSSYKQTQVFRLEPGASIVMLDWITAGRMSRGERWDFSKYCSVNEVWIDGKRIARDVLLLEDQVSGPDHLLIPRRTLKERMGIYACYANLFLHGPLVQTVVTSLTAQYDEISIFQQAYPSNVLWSLSAIEGGYIVRIAGTETELVKSWLRGGLKDLERIIGIDVYNNAFP